MFFEDQILCTLQGIPLVKQIFTIQYGIYEEDLWDIRGQEKSFHFTSEMKTFPSVKEETKKFAHEV